jgi:hypothetical protein
VLQLLLECGDLIHRAIRRILESDGQQGPVAASVCVINLSIGIMDRLFDSSLSPLSKLLDWLAWKYQILFVVSAGNHGGNISLNLTNQEMEQLTPQELQNIILRSVAADARHKRLLSPAESVNSLTVGATHEDASMFVVAPDVINPYINTGMPSPFNAQGMGFRRSIKPEILLPGGRILFRRYPGGGVSRLEMVNFTSPPGQRVAAPGPDAGVLNATWHTRGTSNSTALASRGASILYDVLEELMSETNGTTINNIPRSIWLKAMLVHSAHWGDSYSVLAGNLRTVENAGNFNEYVTRLLGYGKADLAKVAECRPYRVTVLSQGTLRDGQAHRHRIPLPDSLHGRACRKTLTITLAWLTPVNMFSQKWRRAHLWFRPPMETLSVERDGADWMMVQRGTVQHEVLTGEQVAAFNLGDHLEIQVNCRKDAGDLDEDIPYALITTLEVEESIGIDIYTEVRTRIRTPRVQIN